MRKIEIKEIGVSTVFKVSIYFTLIPAALLFVLGLVITLIGAASGQSALLFVGIPYLFMSIIMVFLNGLINMLVSLIYNKLTKKFGGLELVLTEKNDFYQQ